MEVMERLIYLFRKFHQLKISNEEYACMKAINFLNQGRRTASVPSGGVERRRDLTWFLCLLCRRHQRTVQHLPARAAQQALLVRVPGLHRVQVPAPAQTLPRDHDVSARDPLHSRYVLHSSPWRTPGGLQPPPTTCGRVPVVWEV